MDLVSRSSEPPSADDSIVKGAPKVRDDSPPPLPEGPPPRLLLVEAAFPEWTPEQHAQLALYAALLRAWNARMNLVSRKDIDHLEEHHLLPALGIAKVLQLGRSARILDVGTGGGLPGLPLAIAFPQARFFLLDSMAKKITAVKDMIARIGLKNVDAVHKRAEELESKFDFVVGRAVAELPEIIGWTLKNLRAGQQHQPANGYLYLKGDRYEAELASARLRADAVYPLSRFFAGEYFADKFVVFLDERSLRRWR